MKMFRMWNAAEKLTASIVAERPVARGSRSLLRLVRDRGAWPIGKRVAFRKRAARGEKVHDGDFFVPEHQTIGHRRPVSIAFHGIPSFPEHLRL